MKAPYKALDLLGKEAREQHDASDFLTLLDIIQLYSSFGAFVYMYM
jgi:hypothetical protein